MTDNKSFDDDYHEEEGVGTSSSLWNWNKRAQLSLLQEIVDAGGFDNLDLDELIRNGNGRYGGADTTIDRSHRKTVYNTVGFWRRRLAEGKFDETHRNLRLAAKQEEEAERKAERKAKQSVDSPKTPRKSRTKGHGTNKSATKAPTRKASFPDKSAKDNMAEKILAGKSKQKPRNSLHTGQCPATLKLILSLRAQVIRLGLGFSRRQPPWHFCLLCRTHPFRRRGTEL